MSFSFPSLRTVTIPMHGQGLASSEAPRKRSVKVYTRLRGLNVVTATHSFSVLVTGLHSSLELAMNLRMTLNSSPASTSQNVRA